MTVAIDVSDIRSRKAVKSVLLDGFLFRSRRLIAMAGLGGVALVAFTYGAFSFFGDLADPRAPLPRPRSVAAAMPDLRDGLPELVPARAPLASPVAAQSVVPQSAVQQSPVRPAAVAAPPESGRIVPVAAIRSDAATGIEREATGSVPRPAGLSTKPGPAIESASTVQSERQAAVIAPLRLSKPLAPAKAETVRAKPADDRSAVAAVSRPADAKGSDTRRGEARVADAKPASVKAADPVPAEAPKRNIAAKPAQERPVRAASAEAVPRAASARRAAEEDSDDLGAKVSKGIKAIGGLFSDD